MSIIYDALKKVETSQVNDSKTKIKKIAFGDNFKRFSQWYGKVFYTFLYQDKDPKSKPKIYLLYALMICLGLFIANIFYGWLSQKKQAVSSSQPSTQTPALAPSVSVEAKMETQKESLPEFTLNGVFFSGNEGYALINNRVVKEGDKLDGATVVQISLDEVDLEFNGSIIKLSDSTK